MISKAKVPSYCWNWWGGRGLTVITLSLWFCFIQVAICPNAGTPAQEARRISSHLLIEDGDDMMIILLSIGSTTASPANVTSVIFLRNTETMETKQETGKDYEFVMAVLSPWAIIILVMTTDCAATEVSSQWTVGMFSGVTKEDKDIIMVDEGGWGVGVLIF